MRYGNTMAAAAPHLVVVAIAEEAARQKGLAPATARLNPPVAPGRLERVVRFGDWRAQLESQIAHPEQLRDDHCLRCEVVLAPWNEAHAGFEPVDATVAQRLGLPPFPVQFCLRVAEDPTRATAAPRRTLIPERYRKPWEFQVSREAAIAQMDKDARPGWRERLARFLDRRAAERATDHWRGQLEGKPLLEQLWGVRPPRSALQRAAVRKWVESALAGAGWDPVRGGREWEIFWRRKGV